MRAENERTWGLQEKGTSDSQNQKVQIQSPLVNLDADGSLGFGVHDLQVRRSGGSEFYSQNTAGFSIESSSRNSFPCSSRRSCNLKVFTLDELKLATKNLSQSLIIGDDGFGGIYRVIIHSSEDPKKGLALL
ncbi:hypothetical protein Ancab_001341 [Ancistrocladus abbreviatus]